MDTVNWPSVDGGVYAFTVFDPSQARWNAVAGVYIFAKPLGGMQWQAIYIGQTTDFSARLPGHEQWVPACRLGATHVHALVVASEATRLSLERGLVLRCQPPLNDQLR